MDNIRDIGKQLYVSESERAAVLKAAEESYGFLHFENLYRRRDGSHFTANLYLTVVRDRDGSPRYLEGMVEDISRRKEIEERLRRQKRTLTSILEHTSDVIVRSDLQQRHIYANPQLYQHTGLSPEEYLGATNEELGMPQELCERLRKTGEAALESGEPQKLTFSYDTVDLGRRWFHTTAYPEYDEHGEPVSLLSFMHDVTELQEARTQLEEREAQLRSVFAALQEGVLVYDTQWKLLFCNDRAPEILGRSREQLEGDASGGMRDCCRLLDRSGKPLAEGEHPAVHTLRTGESCRGRVLGIERDDGEPAWLSFNAEALKLGEDEATAGVVVSFRDITREERYTRQLKELADTKEHLLVEINHRVKNHLLTVEALANLERYDPAKDKEEALQDIVNRIRAISLVHQKLYTTGQFASLHAGAYLRELVDTIVQTHAHGSQDCPVRCDVDELRLPPKRLTTLGLIVSELLNNTVKHAGCPAGAPVSIALRHREGRAVLDYRDSGPGLPPGITSVEELASGTGIRLVGMLVSDMDGEIDINPEAESPAAEDAARNAQTARTTPTDGGAGGEERGVHFRISFPLD
jgi:PAS domain S-box-containing protein